MKKYVLYGTGIEGEKFLFHHMDKKEKIAYCVDAFHKGTFHGIPILGLETAFEKGLSGYKIIVAAVAETYLAIKKLLEEKGLVEFRHFIWSRLVGKKLVLINTNCYKGAIIRYLEKSAEFREKNTIYPIPEICANKEKRISDELLENTDIYIHQDIRADNGFGYMLSDEYIIPKLRKSCLSITVPNFVGMAGWMFPMQENSRKKKDLSEGGYKAFLADRILDEAYGKGLKALDEYVAFWYSYAYERGMLEERFQKDMQKLCKREADWDIKVSNYILKNYEKLPLFVDMNHPSKYLMREICRQLAENLGITDIEDDSNYESHLCFWPSGILPCVKDCFHMEFPDICEEINNKLYDKPTFEIQEYVKWYIWWYYEVYLE